MATQGLEYGAPVLLAEARRVIAAAEREAAAHDWAMVIAVADSSGHLVALHRMDQAQYGSIAVAQAKASTAVNFKRPTKVFEELVTGGAMRLLSIEGLVALEGGVPLVRGGKLVGAIGVSGATGAQDGQVAAAGALVLDGVRE